VLPSPEGAEVHAQLPGEHALRRVEPLAGAAAISGAADQCRGHPQERGRGDPEYAAEAPGREGVSGQAGAGCDRDARSPIGAIRMKPTSLRARTTRLRGRRKDLHTGPRECRGRDPGVDRDRAGAGPNKSHARDPQRGEGARVMAHVRPSHRLKEGSCKSSNWPDGKIALPLPSSPAAGRGSREGTDVRTALPLSFPPAAGGGAASETEGKIALLPSSSPAAGRLPARGVLRFDRRGSGSRGMVFRHLQKAAVAAPDMVSVRPSSVGDTVGCASNGIVGSTLNGFCRSRPCARRQTARDEHERQR